jgi:hypothetical protein
LAFLLDIVEVPESHTGVALAKAFQQMLESFGLQDRVCLLSNTIIYNANLLYQQILAMNADNATSNDTQGETLAHMPNSFKLENRARCFNHTLQLSAKTLLRPFNVGLGKTTDDDGGVDDLLDQDNASDNEDEDGDGDGDVGLPDFDDVDDGIDELDELDEDARNVIIADTAAVRETVSKIRQLAFSIVRSTTIALPAWRRHCKALKLKPCILPRDVVTRWNSTYYMLSFASKYRSAIDAMTADKSLKLRKLELEVEEWTIVEDLVSVLLVRIHKCYQYIF